MAEQRLIDANALIEKYGDWYTEEGTEEGYIGTIKGIVDSMPTIEPKMGKWIPGREVSRTFFGPNYIRIDYEDWRCSACGCVVEQWWKPNYNFCPNCGADMRGEEDENSRSGQKAE